MRIVDSIGDPVRIGISCDDQPAIRTGATQRGFLYEGRPRAPGFRRSTSRTQPGRSCSSHRTDRSRWGKSVKDARADPPPRRRSCS